MKIHSFLKGNTQLCDMHLSKGIYGIPTRWMLFRKQLLYYIADVVRAKVAKIGFVLNFLGDKTVRWSRT